MKLRKNLVLAAALVSSTLISTKIASVGLAEEPTTLAPSVQSKHGTAPCDFATDVFVSGEGGYHTYRIPSLLVTKMGTLLAFCEGRKSSRSDAGDIDLLLRRSLDKGRTWEVVQVVYEEGGAKPVTIGNPCPVVDQQTGTIWLPFCRNNRDVLITSSADDGLSWTEPRDITVDVKKPSWGWYATGPGVGIQLQHGSHKDRLVIPCDHRDTVDGKKVMASHVFYSDDHGKTWELGGILDRHTDECQVVELASGELMMNARNYWGRDGGRPRRGGKRAIAPATMVAPPGPHSNSTRRSSNRFARPVSSHWTLPGNRA